MMSWSWTLWEDVYKRQQRTRLATAKQRVSELEVLLCKIYEDNILGKLSDSRYATLDLSLIHISGIRPPCKASSAGRSRSKGTPV